MMEDAVAWAGTLTFRQWQGGATDHQPPGHGQRAGCSEGLLRAWWSKQRRLKWIRRGPFMRAWDECWLRQLLPLSLAWEQSSSIYPKGQFDLITKPWLPALECHLCTVPKLNSAYSSAHLTGAATCWDTILNLTNVDTTYCMYVTSAVLFTYKCAQKFVSQSYFQTNK